MKKISLDCYPMTIQHNGIKMIPSSRGFLFARGTEAQKKYKIKLTGFCDSINTVFAEHEDLVVLFVTVEVQGNTKLTFRASVSLWQYFFAAGEKPAILT